MTPDFEKMNGLIPAIVQDAFSERVLMLGYMNEAALKKTQDSGLVTFYSRSRKALWTKGETSGNTLELISLALDCDNDSILVRAKPNGPTCHTGATSCFGEDKSKGLGFLATLSNLIDDRRAADPESSYTAQLLQGPLKKPAQKVGEEGLETALAAVAESDEAYIYEAADLLYHLLVLNEAKSIGLDKILTELASRHKPA